jgi:hypothetical protein
MSNALAQKTLELTRVCSELLKRAQTAQEKAAHDKQAVDSAVSDAVAALIKHERIYENQGNAVREKIASSHVACVELIRDLAAHRNSAEAGQSIGKPMNKAASDKPRTRPLGSPVADYDELESGRVFREQLLGAR